MHNLTVRIRFWTVLLSCKSTKNLEFPMKMGWFKVFCVLGNKFWLIVNYRYLCMKLGKSWGVSWGISIPQGTFDVYPVSYTHLYYKSEWYACCSLRLNILYKERLVLHFEEVKQNYVRPVSYTHLDVYKRQILENWFSICLYWSEQWRCQTG